MKYSLIALALLIPAAASAQGTNQLSYSYVEAGYYRFEGDAKADGVLLGGSFALGERFHVFGAYADFDWDNDFLDRFDLDDDFAPFDGNAERWWLGVGYNHSLNDSMDLVARAAYQKDHVSGFGSDDGWFAEVGVRSLFTPRLEGYAFAGYEDMENLSGEVFGRLGGVFHFTDRWGLNLDVKLIDGDEQYFIGPRFSF